MAAKKTDNKETPAEAPAPVFPGVNDEQAKVLIRHAGEEMELQIKHSNERLVLQQRHKKERDAAQINMMTANGPVGMPTRG